MKYIMMLVIGIAMMPYPRPNSRVLCPYNGKQFVQIKKCIVNPEKVRVSGDFQGLAPLK